MVRLSGVLLLSVLLGELFSERSCKLGSMRRL